jgi:hypothetical protein
MNKCGFYQVNSKIFKNKNHAVYEASINNSKVTWNFYNDVFENFSQTKLHTLGQLPLDDWYKLRAEQLRDSYDYLILNYSGGPDSHNVLMTFLNNNIKLDEIYVKYSHSVDAKIYTPNNVNKGAENIHSEWDYVIKPVLDNIKISHPQIKIVIDDVFDNPLNISDETLLNAPSHFLGSFELMRQCSYSKSVNEQQDKGKRVADIYGIDKPLILYKDKSLFIFFADNTVGVAGNRNSNIELFYWTPDLPNIVFEQAYRHYLYFKKNPDMISLIDVKTIKKNDHQRQEKMRKLAIDLIYTTWDYSKFQVEKPEYYTPQGRTRDKYYLLHSEFNKQLDMWNYHMNSWSSAIHTTYFNKQTMTLEILLSKWYKFACLE